MEDEPIGIGGCLGIIAFVVVIYFLFMWFGNAIH